MIKVDALDPSKTEKNNEDRQKPKSDFEGFLAHVAFWFAGGILALFSISISEPSSSQSFFVTILSIVGSYSSVNWGLVSGKEYDRLRTIPYPTIFLSVGIMGTFWGIFIGLDDLGLDVTKTLGVSELGRLIEGLRLSLLTSLLGISLAITCRILVVFFGKPIGNETGADDIVDAINSMGSKLDEFIQDLNDKVVQGLTDALQSLARNLDTVLADQLGEAFRDLNESIMKLNTWVEAYGEQVETLTQAYKDNLVSIETFHDEAEKITNALALVPRQTSGIQSTLEKMNIPLTEFAELGSRASDAFPIIESRLDKVTTKFGNSAEKLGEVVAMAAKLETELSEKTKNIEELIRQATEKQFASFEGQLAAISEKFATDYIPIADALRRVLQTLDTRVD